MSELSIRAGVTAARVDTAMIPDCFNSKEVFHTGSQSFERGKVAKQWEGARELGVG